MYTDGLRGGQGVQNVLNFDFPRGANDYVHRVGRYVGGTCCFESIGFNGDPFIVVHLKTSLTLFNLPRFSQGSSNSTIGAHPLQPWYKNGACAHLARPFWSWPSQAAIGDGELVGGRVSCSAPRVSRTKLSLFLATDLRTKPSIRM